MATKKNGQGGFNLAALDTVSACNKPIEIEIMDVNGKPTGVFFSILGRDSDAARRQMRAFADEALRGKESDDDYAEKRSIAWLAAVTVGWRDGDSPALEWGDERLEYSPGNARKVYAALIPVREQVSRAAYDLNRFMKG